MKFINGLPANETLPGDQQDAAQARSENAHTPDLPIARDPAQIPDRAPYWSRACRLSGHPYNGGGSRSVTDANAGIPYSIMTDEPYFK